MRYSLVLFLFLEKSIAGVHLLGFLWCLIWVSPLEQRPCFALLEGHHEVKQFVGLTEPLALESPCDQESGHPFVDLTDQDLDLVLENLTVQKGHDYLLVNLTGQERPDLASVILFGQELLGLASVNLIVLDVGAVHPALVASHVEADQT